MMELRPLTLALDLTARRKEVIRNLKWNPELREPRIGVMVHYDASTSDKGAVAWFKDPRCEVSYQFLVLDDGSFVEIAPITARAWHAGICKPSNERLKYTDANSAFVGIAIAASAHESATAAQLLTVASLTRLAFDHYRWPTHELWRITGHDQEAWQRGRKIDPTGPDPKKPVMSVTDIQHLVSKLS